MKKISSTAIAPLFSPLRTPSCPIVCHCLWPPGLNWGKQNSTHPRTHPPRAGAVTQHASRVALEDQKAALAQPPQHVVGEGAAGQRRRKSPGTRATATELRLGALKRTHTKAHKRTPTPTHQHLCQVAKDWGRGGTLFVALAGF